MASVSPNLATLRGSRGDYRWSLDEYYKLSGAGLFQDRRTELLKGALVIMPLPDEPNNQAVIAIAERLREAFGPGFQVREEKAFVIEPDTDVGPDVTVVRKSELAPGRKPTRAELIVEVSGSTLDYDLGEKAALYASAGVPEYWVVDLNERCIHVHRSPGAGVYASVTQSPAGAQVTPLDLTHQAIDIVDLLP